MPPTKKPSAKTKPGQATQKEMRRGVDVDGNMFSVISAAAWHRQGHFANDDEARGAFKLAYQQAMDGMGRTPAEWMGLTDEEYSRWAGGSEALPLLKKKR